MMTTEQFFIIFISFLIFFSVLAVIFFIAGVADYAAERKTIKGGRSLK